MQSKNRISLAAFVFSCLFLLTVSFLVSKWDDWESQKLITWDSSGYYMYLPGFFYDDLGNLNNHQYIIDQYKPCGNYLNEYKSPIGKYVIKYSSGMAIMYLPGFAAGHLYAKLAHYPVDGFSHPYQFCMAIYSLLISFLGLWFIRKILLKYFSDGVTAFTILSLILATNYLNYSAISNMFPHNYLFTVYAILIYLSIQWHQQYDYKRSIIIGLLCGLSALSRPTDMIAVIIPLLWGVDGFYSLKERFNVLFRERKKLIVLFLSAVLIGSIQLIYWKIYSGKFIYWSYGNDDGLNFLKVHFWNCLFSYKKGWFVYTPFMVLSVIGFIPLYKNHEQLFWSNIVFIFIALYIVFSWRNWAYGGSFSMRAVVQYYAILVFPMAALFEYAFKKWKTRLPLFLYFIFCTWVNLVMTYQANGAGIMESDNMSRAYYWKIFGKLKMDKGGKKLIDTDEEMPDEKVSALQPLLQRVFCNDSTNDNCVEFKSFKAYFMQKGIEFLPETRIDISEKKGRWYRITCEVFMVKDEPDYWNQPQLYTWLSDENLKDIKQKNYRIQRIASFSDWDKLTIDILISSDSKGKVLKAGIYNSKGDAKFYVRSLRIDSVEE